MKLFFIRYTKIVFIYLKLHKIFGLFTSFNANMLYLSKLSAWASKNRKLEYNDFPSKWDYEKRYPMYKWVLEKENLSTAPVNYLEFGVAAGQSFRWFLQQNTHPESRFSAFDTFTGLPEDFGVYKKGAFNSTIPSNQKLTTQEGNFTRACFSKRFRAFLQNSITKTGI